MNHKFRVVEQERNEKKITLNRRKEEISHLGDVSSFKQFSICNYWKIRTKKKY